jgi:hypothetical protein
LDRLQVGADSLDRPRTGLSSIAKIEHESRIADHVTAEPGRRHPAVA